MSRCCFTATQAFIHGINQNPVAALARELGLTMIPMDDCKLSDSGGRPVAEATDGRIQALWNRVLDECAEKQDAQNNNVTVNDHSSTVSSNDSPGDTSVESHGEGNSSAESEAPEATSANDDHALGVTHMHKETPRGAEGADKDRNGRPEQDSSNPVGKGKARSKEKGNGRLGGGAVLARQAQGARATLRNPASLGQVLEETARVHLASLSKAEHELWGWHRGNLEISCGAVSTAVLYRTSIDTLDPSFFFFFFLTLLLSSFWTSRGWSQVSSLLPPGSCLQFLSRIGFSNPTARRFFIECC